MSIEVRIPTILRQYTGGEKAVEGSGGTLAALIDDLESRHAGLRSAKHERLATALSTLGEEPHKMVLDADEAQAWLGALNDSRLVLGERLGVTEDLEELISALGEDDPRLALLWVYDRLTYLQESLVQALWGSGP